MAKRIYFGGTFNPIHIGHLRVALECQRQLDAEFSFVPCGDPPHKKSPEVAARQRLHMVKLAVAELNTAAGAESFFAEPMEVERSERSFTIKTVQSLRAAYPQDTLFWLIGMDSLVNFASWHRWRELVDFTNVLVVNRPGWQMPGHGVVGEWLQDKLVAPEAAPISGKVVMLETTPLAISSSNLRSQLHHADFAKFLIPESVRQYAYEQRLYCSNNRRDL